MDMRMVVLMAFILLIVYVTFIVTELYMTSRNARIVRIMVGLSIIISSLTYDRFIGCVMV